MNKTLVAAAAAFTVNAVKIEQGTFDAGNTDFVDPFNTGAAVDDGEAAAFNPFLSGDDDAAVFSNEEEADDAVEDVVADIIEDVVNDPNIDEDDVADVIDEVIENVDADIIEDIIEDNADIIDEIIENVDEDIVDDIIEDIVDVVEGGDFDDLDIDLGNYGG